MNAELLALRFIHIVGGVFWVGSGLFTAFFLVPALARSGPAAGQVMVALQQRRLFTVLPAVALLTIVSGIRLMWIVSAGFSASYVDSRMGQMLAWSALASVVAFVLSLVVSRPTAVRSATLAQSFAAASNDAERERMQAELMMLRKRGAVASIVGVALAIIAAGGMAVARYL